VPATSASRSRLAFDESVLATTLCALSSASSSISSFAIYANEELSYVLTHANQDRSRFMSAFEMTRTAPLVIGSHLQPIPPFPTMKPFTMYANEESL